MCVCAPSVLVACHRVLSFATALQGGPRSRVSLCIPRLLLWRRVPFVADRPQGERQMPCWAPISASDQSRSTAKAAEKK